MNRALSWNVRKLVCMLGCLSFFSADQAQAQVTISDGGSPSYVVPIGVPPGIAGTAPQLSLSYSGGSGFVGNGWSLQGLSAISRCPGSRLTDGTATVVSYGINDKLCLDGSRLIQTDASGNLLSFPQAADAKGLSSGWREYRTEKDTFVRVRAYGIANSADTNGPAYFKVWTKAGQVYEYGASPSADGNTHALVNAQGKTVASVWAVSRITDALGNYIDFKYDQRQVAWGSGTTAGAGLPGVEWNITEIQYTGNSSLGQAPANKVVFSYQDRAVTTPADAFEGYHQGSKTVSLRLLKSVTTYVNSPNPSAIGPGSSAVPVKTLVLTYDNGPVTKRSRLWKVSECAGGPGSTRCLPATTFTYSPGTGEALTVKSAFNLDTKKLTSIDGKYGVLTADFNGDGRTDLLRWSENGAENELWLSRGDGTFQQMPNGGGTGQFGLSQQLMSANGCYFSMVLDANGDGLPDIVRIASSTDNAGASCGLPMQAMYFLNNGNGGFTPRTLTTVSGTALPLERKVSTTKNQQFCGMIAAGPMDKTATADMILALTSNCRWGSGWTAGAAFYFLDVNGDGLLDVITTSLAALAPQDPLEFPDNPSMISCSGCTRVFIANTNGTFDEKLDSNLRNYAVYSNPGVGANLRSMSRANDIDGDGLSDLFSVGTPRKNQSWRSSGDGNFSSVGSVANCDMPIDFNGDGRADCLRPYSDPAGNYLSLALSLDMYSPVANFNLKGGGNELSSQGMLTPGSNYGAIIIDADRDGRQDILRWHDDPTRNILYLSNGDGTFRTSTSFLPTVSAQLKHSNGNYDFVTGDFTGRGATELLRISGDAPTTSTPANRNILYVPADPAPADQLTAVKNSNGVTTSLLYTPLSASDSALGPRYKSDRNTAYAATFPNVDLIPPMYVVTTMTTDSGPGTGGVSSEFAYVGLKSGESGRGLLGFRQTLKQAPGPNGDLLTLVTDFGQDIAYTGMARRSETRLGGLNASNPMWISRTTTVYCDRTAAAGAEASINENSANCATTAKIQRPYARFTKEESQDLNGVALPTVTTVKSFNDYGDPTSIVITTSGTAAGVSQVTTKTTTNQYFPENIAGDNWILGRLQRATVQSSVPNSLASISTSAGSAPLASANKGTLPAGTITPAQLQVILSLLLDD